MIFPPINTLIVFFAGITAFPPFMYALQKQCAILQTVHNFLKHYQNVPLSGLSSIINKIPQKQPLRFPNDDMPAP